MEKQYKIIKIKKLPEGEVEIEAEVEAEILKNFREKALASIQKEAALPGFRKGHVPEKMLIERVGEMHVLEEAAKLALEKIYPTILIHEKIDAIGRPEITITKLALGNNLAFKATTAVLPPFNLPDYKSIAQKILSGKPAPKENTTPTEQMIEKEKTRLEIIKKIIGETKIDLPKIIVESELDRMLQTFELDAKRAGTTVEAYLTEVKKTKEDLREEWRESAHERVKTELILSKIAASEKTYPTEKEIEQNVLKIAAQNPEADKNRLHLYVAQVLTNEKVFDFLESQR